MMGLTVFSTSAAGITPRVDMSCSIHAVATPPTWRHRAPRRVPRSSVLPEDGRGERTRRARLLKRHGLRVEDIDLWELNEAFASQCLYSRDRLGIDPEKYNVNGGSIAVGHRSA